MLNTSEKCWCTEAIFPLKMCYFIKDISVLTKDPLEKCWSPQKVGGGKHFDVVQFMD